MALQKLDQKTLQRLEIAVAKSEYSQGKKLKVVPKVCLESTFWLVVNTDYFARWTLISKAD